MFMIYDPINKRFRGKMGWASPLSAPVVPFASEGDAKDMIAFYGHQATMFRDLSNCHVVPYSEYFDTLPEKMRIKWIAEQVR